MLVDTSFTTGYVHVHRLIHAKSRAVLPDQNLAMLLRWRERSWLPSDNTSVEDWVYMGGVLPIQSQIPDTEDLNQPIKEDLC